MWAFLYFRTFPGATALGGRGEVGADQTFDGGNGVNGDYSEQNWE